MAGGIDPHVNMDLVRPMNSASEIGAATGSPVVLAQCAGGMTGWMVGVSVACQVLAA